MHLYSHCTNRIVVYFSSLYLSFIYYLPIARAVVGAIPNQLIGWLLLRLGQDLAGASGRNRQLHKMICGTMHARASGWVGGSVAHHAHLLEQTKSSVVVVTNNRGVTLVGWVGPSSLSPQLAASYAPDYQGWAILAARPQACRVAVDVLGRKLKC
jgi:hypothetical protein